MWNYDYVLPGIMVLIIFVTYYFSRPRLPLRMNKVYLTLMMLHVLTILTDYLGSRACENYQSIPAFLVWSLNMAFFLCFMGRIFLFYLFNYCVLGFADRKGYLLGLVFTVCELVALSSVVTGAVFYVDGAGYHRGPFYFVIYVCGFFYALLGIGQSIYYRKRRKVSEIRGLIACQMILFIGYFVRMFMKDYLVMNTFCLLALIVIYLSFENPDIYASSRGIAFNTHAAHDMLTELISFKKDWSILGFVIRDYNDERTIYSGTQMDTGLGLISTFLSARFPDSLVFYLRNGCYILINSPDCDCESMVRTIEERFKQPWNADDVNLYLEVCFVEVDSEENRDSADRIIGNILIALDSAGQAAVAEKASRRQDLFRTVEHQIDVKSALERSLKQNEVEVFLQPLIDARTGRLVAAEALARIRDISGNLISPGVFIPIAEKNGHVSLLGEQVFRKTCEFIHDNDMEGMGLSWINVNLSPIQCMNNDIAERLSRIIGQCNVSTSEIHLEITEQSMIDYSMLQKQILRLRKLGFEFALDDYGSGYSNLTRVKHYPFSNIKLDMEVVWDYFRAPDNLLPSLVQTFKQMDLTITAEGIETREMADAMKAIGCDYLQGYYFSKPLPMNEFIRKYGVS